MKSSSRAIGRSLGLEGSLILNIWTRSRCRLEAVVVILHRLLSFAEAAVVWGAFLRHARTYVLAMASSVSQGEGDKVELIGVLSLSRHFNLALSVALDLILIVILMRVRNAVVGRVSNHKGSSVIISSIQLTCMLASLHQTKKNDRTKSTGTNKGWEG